ncbi:MAG: HD-GYP domain-containing protein [Bacteroidota bacterium]
MKIISVDSIQPGMQIARDLYGPNGVVLLKRGVSLTDAMIRSISRLNYSSVYIQDGADDEESLVEAEVIAESKRQETVQIIRQFCETSLKSSKFSSSTGLDVTSVMRAAKDIVQSVMSNPNAVISLIDLKSFDDYTFQHSVSVCMLSVVVGRRLRLPIANLEDLALGAMLHDLGKVTLPLDVLNKPGKLTSTEFDLIKTHPRAGFELLSGNRFISAHAKAVVLQHQEKFNGQGYPKGMSGQEIHLNGRIGALVDVYDALTSDRPYRPRMYPHKALQIIKEGSGTHFDPELVELFLTLVSPYPLGTRMVLNSGEEVAVVRVPPTQLDRPIVQVMGGEPRLVDLSQRPDLQIERVLETP